MSSACNSGWGVRARAVTVSDIYEDTRNPGLPYVVTIRYGQRRAWSRTTAFPCGRWSDTAFAQFHARRWAVGEGSWLPPGAWNACVGTPTLREGEDVWIGVDVGGERSATAVTWVNATIHVGCRIYHGDAGVLEAVDHVRALAGTYNVRELVYDPWRFGQAAQELEREGMLVVAFPQHDTRMIPHPPGLHAAIVEQRITLPDDQELAHHASDAIARHSRRGWRIDKPNPRANIDAIIALAMAVERAQEKPEPGRAARMALKPCLGCGRLTRDSRCAACRRASPYQQPAWRAPIPGGHRPGRRVRPLCEP